LTSIQAAADDDELRRMWPCWCPHIQSGRCATDTSVSTWNFKEYWNLSVIRWLHHVWSFHSHPPRGKQCAYSVADVFSGSVAT